MEHLKEWEVIKQNLINGKSHKTIVKFFDFALHNSLSIALWRQPRQLEKHLILDLTGEVNYVKADLEELNDGFILSPFSNKNGVQSIFINNHFYYSTRNKHLAIAPYLDSSVHGRPDLEKLLASLGESFIQPVLPKTRYHVNPSSPSDSSSKAHYIDTVNSAIEAINQGAFTKVVPARMEKITLDDSFDLVAAFEKACQLYPNALVSVVSVPGIGTWMGATPEELISFNKAKQFSTVSLAGTQKIDDDTDLMEVAWRQKEIEEQAMVSRYIIDCFKKIRLREYQEYGPRTARAGKLAHLKTDFVVDTIATNFPQLATVMLGLLHPTSAVCGMPKAPATQFLLAHENFDRSFFSGFLGPVNMFEETHLFVNIRCMQLFDKEAILYAGAGVTAFSDVEKEWEETHLKCQTMRKVLH